MRSRLSGSLRGHSGVQGLTDRSVIPEVRFAAELAVKEHRVLPGGLAVDA